MTTIEFNRNLLNLERKLRNFSLKLTGSREEAQDLYQETLLKALVNRNKITHNNLQAWVYTIMRNTFINGYRKKQNHQTRLEDQEKVLEFWGNGSGTAAHPVSVWYYKEIMETIEKLEDTCKVPLQLYINGFKYREIAHQLMLPLGTVKSRIHLGRQELMKRLKAYQAA